jgi:hypothetical protein
MTITGMNLRTSSKIKHITLLNLPFDIIFVRFIFVNTNNTRKEIK